jgi:hypothetical protein
MEIVLLSLNSRLKEAEKMVNVSTDKKTKLYWENVVNDFTEAIFAVKLHWFYIHAEKYNKQLNQLLLS